MGALTGSLAEPPAPRGIADPNIAKLFVTTRWPVSGIAAVGPDHLLEVRGRNFPVGQELTLLVRTDGMLPQFPSNQMETKETVRTGKDGTFSTTLPLRRDLPYGMHRVEAIAGPEGKTLAVADFVKTPAADEGAEGDILR